MKFFRDYCLECNCVHWVEVTEARRQVCHGRNFFPRETATHYTRWNAGGIALCEKASAKPAALPLDWQFLEQLAEQNW
jgi:hypothetical protein